MFKSPVKETIKAGDENKSMRTSRTRPLAEVADQDWSEVDRTTDEEIKDSEAEEGQGGREATRWPPEQT